MKTMDVFDTLIARWYADTDSNISLLGERLNIDNFVWYRKHAENLASTKTLPNIYVELSKLLGWDDKRSKEIMDLEVEIEIRHMFPIFENVNKLDVDTVLVSDTFYTKEQLIHILSSLGITKFRDLICSYSGKRDGWVWSEFSTTHHLGDNKVSDFDVPTSKGISCELYSGTKFTDQEKFYISKGFYNLACLCRATRLSCSVEDVSGIWLEQSQYNLPLLILISNYLKTYVNNNMFGHILFTQRDCCNLYRVFSTMYPDIKSDPFYTSRLLYSTPTKNFVKYTDSIVTDKTLIVDLQGTGNTCKEFFKGKLSPNYFTVVDSNLGENSVPSIVKRMDNFSDKIERLNYDLGGKYIDVSKKSFNWVGIRDSFTFNPHIYTQSLFNNVALQFLIKGFRVENTTDTSLIKDILKSVEDNCHICKVVNHEEI